MTIKKFIIPCLWILVTGLPVFVVLIFLGISFSKALSRMPTQVSFQSSDGGWTEHEDLFKLTTDFYDVVHSFELYKIQCHKPNVLLQRITKRPQKGTPEDRVNDYHELKWAVPYANPLPTVTRFYEPENRQSCARLIYETSTEEEKKLARRRTEQYIDEGKKQGWSIKRLQCEPGKGCQIVTE